jgi:hypothetical protein
VPVLRAGPVALHWGRYVRALLEEGTEDLLEAAGVVKVPCDNCGYVALFDAETIGIRGLWAEGRDL